MINFDMDNNFIEINVDDICSEIKQMMNENNQLSENVLTYEQQILKTAKEIQYFESILTQKRQQLADISKEYAELQNEVKSKKLDSLIKFSEDVKKVLARFFRKSKESREENNDVMDKTYDLSAELNKIRRVMRERELSDKEREHYSALLLEIASAVAQNL